MDEETRLTHAGAEPKPLVRTVGPPIQKGSTVLLSSAAALYDDDAFLTYGRQGLATHEALCEALAELEGAEAVTLYPSGVAALSGAMLAMLNAGDAVRVADTCYRPTRRFCDKVLKRFGVEVDYYDPRLPPEAVFDGAPANLRLVVLESPGSLSMEMQDVPAIAAAARSRDVLTLADNTWAAGLTFKPLAYGVDISVQALTKYVGGCSDVFMGSAATSDPAHARQLADGINHLGWAVSGEEAYLMLRGLRSLSVRLTRHGESALAVAQWLRARPEVGQVLYPALPGAPGHEIWKRDFTGACGLLSFTLAGGTPKAADAFLDALELFGLGFSWGGFESLALTCDPQFTGRRHRHDYGGPMIRLHIGLESPADLIADLVRGFAGFAGAP
jgi:cystathionine beta-lyase